jgi:cation transport regulator ChaB
MPYSSLDDLPSTVRDVLPKPAQEIYFSAFNAAYSDTCKDREDRDTCAAKIAWSAVSNSYVKSGDDWQKREEATGRGTANVTDFEVFDETIQGNLKKDSISDSGMARIRIIKPGWGSSGYYNENVLKRDAAKVYVPGLHMYLNHPSTSEEKTRPERDVRDLAGVIAGSVKYEDNGPVLNPADPTDHGQGVYADALIFKDKRAFLGEIAPYIGISHRVMGKSVTGEADGRKGPIIESLEKGVSVDYVTMPGAGGGISQLYESWRDTGHVEHAPTGEHEQHQEIKEMDITIEEVRKNAGLMKELRETILAEQEAEGEAVVSKEEELMAQIEEYKKKIAELQAELDRMTEKESVSEAMRIATSELAKTALPEVTKSRLIETLPRHVTIKEGKLDEAAFRTALTESVKAETDYITKLTETGKVRGFGGKPAGNDATATLKESFKSAFLASGMNEAEAEKKAILATEGRR